MNLEELIRRDEERITVESAEEYRRLWAKELKYMPKNSEIWPHLSDHDLISYFKTRSVRTESGVAPMAVMMKPHHCPGKCIYCPLEGGMPKSYLSDEPAAQRAKKLNFDPYKQVEMRLKQMEETGHVTDKIDLIVVGGTFGSYPDDYKIEFFKGMFDGVNGYVSKSLEEAIKYNESASRRIVGISVETRPDWVTEDEVKLWRGLGVTKVQLGVQAFDEKILKIIERGHDLETVAEATRLCRNAGLKICYHLMPDLPGSTEEKDVEMARMMFEDPRFGPDYLKVYPAMVIPGTEMYKMWQKGEYKSYGEEKLKEVLKKIKLMTPPWCRIDRLVRDISKKWVASGSLATNMRQMIQEELKTQRIKNSKNQNAVGCRCIRCREVRGFRDLNHEARIMKNERETLGGQEIFLSFEDERYLYAMLRLRLPNKNEKVLFEELKNAAIVREVHTYGQVKEIEKTQKLKNSKIQNDEKSQHRGLGKRLLFEAEKIARERGYEKMAIISAVGTREYYRKLGYRLDGTYMIKDLVK